MYFRYRPLNVSSPGQLCLFLNLGSRRSVSLNHYPDFGFLTKWMASDDNYYVSINC